jgi:hypothetical protein
MSPDTGWKPGLRGKKNPPELANLFDASSVSVVEARVIRRAGFGRSTGGGSLTSEENRGGAEKTSFGVVVDQ